MTERFYRPELDVLRFAAFLMVFVAHSAPDPKAWERLGEPLATLLRGIAAAGVYGVDLFFVLSAYLITNLLLREEESTGQIDAWRFYGRRALRIWPLYFACLAATPLFAQIIPGENLPVPYLITFMLFGANWACSFWGYPSSVITPLWSVSIEEQFYVLWPLVISSMRHRLPWVIGAMFAVSTATQLYLVNDEHPAAWCNTLARLQPIAVGAALAIMRPKPNSFLFGLGAVSFVLAGIFGDTYGPASVLTYPAIALASGALVAGMPRVEWPALSYLGRISYGLYVFHALGLALLLRHSAVQSIPEYAIRVAGALSMTIAVAALSYRFLELPFLRLKERIAVIPSRPA